jgi:hypothetical protein
MRVDDHQRRIAAGGARQKLWCGNRRRHVQHTKRISVAGAVTGHKLWQAAAKRHNGRCHKGLEGLIVLRVHEYVHASGCMKVA